MIPTPTLKESEATCEDTAEDSREYEWDNTG